MSDFHDSNYYKRQRIIGRWAFQLFIKLFSGEMLLWAFFKAWKQYPLLGMVTSKETMPYCFLGIGIFITITEFFKLSRDLEAFEAQVLKEKAQSAAKTDNPVKEKSSHSMPPTKSISDFPELLQAIADAKITGDGELLVPRSEFVLYCQEHGYFSPQNRESGWKSIDNLIKDSKKGKCITAKQFRQSYQDLARDGKVPL